MQMRRRIVTKPSAAQKQNCTPIDLMFLHKKEYTRGSVLLQDDSDRNLLNDSSVLRDRTEYDIKVKRAL